MTSNQKPKKYLFLALALFIFLFSSLLATTIAANTANNQNANLTIWTNGTPSGENRTVGGGLSGKTLNDYNFYFIANLTNSTGAYLNASIGSGNCTIVFNISSTLSAIRQMVYQPSYLWVFNRSFNYKGNLSYLITCTSSYGNITNLTDYFYVLNTGPYLSTISSISFSNEEDNFTANNFSQYVIEDDLNDVLSYSILNITSTKHSATSPAYYQNWIWINNSNGLVYVNATNDTEAANYGVTIQVLDGGNNGEDIAGLVKTISINVQPENDPPYFLNLGSSRIVNKSGIGLILSAIDEENDVPYAFNVSFLSCVHTALNPPTGPGNCTLFNLTFFNSTSTNITFVPLGNQKGEYEINFSVVDARNATYSKVINWSITWNDQPFFTYVCNNERNATEGALFNCRINASDTDELNNLTFISNYSWFTFSSLSNITTIITSGGNASALVNFTPSDSQVGNWSINVTITDTGATSAPIETNSTIFSFFISNINDSVFISDIPDMTAYTSTTYNILVNVTDDDLLIPDKRVLNETITFLTNNSLVSISNQIYISGTNRTQATLSFDPNSLGVGAHTINVTAQDKYNNSIASDLFTITVVGNSAPQWNESMARNFNLTENSPFYLNLSKNVTDTDSLTFSLTHDSYSFNISINPTTGVINFTPNDTDVGFHRVNVTADDGKTPSTIELNFTVSNIPDRPNYRQLYVTNGTLTGGLINVTEDSNAILILQIVDDDFFIEQTSFYNENLTLTLNLTGPNSSLVRFDEGYAINRPSNNIYQYRASFIPKKSDMGNYNLTINITDAAGNFTILRFNLTVTETLHQPNITTAVPNVDLSILNENFYLDVNASDVEDGSDGPVSNLTFRIQNLTSGGNFLEINSTTGVINFTSNSSLAGRWRYKLIVNDTDGMEDSRYFNITIYDFPKMLSPSSAYVFNLAENVSALLNFTANHTVQNGLNFTLTINGVYKNSTTGYGNATEFLWLFAPNFTMETTCSGLVNLTINISNAKLSNVSNWLVNISHTNYPMQYLSDIPDQVGGTPLTLDLSNYFYDLDAADSCVNQPINFVYTRIPDSESGGFVTATFSNWSGNSSLPRATFSVQSDGAANFTVAAFEANSSNSSQFIRNLSSNDFLVSLVVSESASTVQSMGGGGGATRTKIISLKILVPEPVSARQKDKLIIPLGLENDGQVNLKKIYLGASVAKDGELRKDLLASFDRPYFESLPIGTKENVTMVVDIDTNSVGLFEVTVNATVDDPDYYDWAKFYIEIEEDRSVLEKIIFTEEFVIGNPQCAELMDLVVDAKKLYSEGKEEEAVAKSEEALKACNQAITQPPRPRIHERLGDKFIGFTAIASLVAFALGFAYYTYKKISLNRQLQMVGKI